MLVAVTERCNCACTFCGCESNGWIFIRRYELLDGNNSSSRIPMFLPDPVVVFFAICCYHCMVCLDGDRTVRIFCQNRCVTTLFPSLICLYWMAWCAYTFLAAEAACFQRSGHFLKCLWLFCLLGVDFDFRSNNVAPRYRVSWKGPRRRTPSNIFTF